MYFVVILINFLSADVILYLPCSLFAQDSHPYNKARNVKVFCIFDYNINNNPNKKILLYFIVINNAGDVLIT